MRRLSVPLAALTATLMLASHSYAGFVGRQTDDPAFRQVGVASWHGPGFHGRRTASGERFDQNDLTAAHRNLPLGSEVRVTNLENGRSIEVSVNDRVPFIGDRLIDLSQDAARKLGYENQGLARVRVDFLALADDARGTPPTPSVVRVARPAAPPPQPRLSLPPNREIQLAALEVPARPVAVAASHVCPVAGPQLVQIGAFGETDQVRTAMATVDDLGPIRIEPAFAGTRAVVRVRLGPVADAAAAQRLLRAVVALGYDDAFLVPAGGGARSASC